MEEAVEEAHLCEDVRRIERAAVIAPLKQPPESQLERSRPVVQRRNRQVHTQPLGSTCSRCPAAAGCRPRLKASVPPGPGNRPVAALGVAGCQRQCFAHVQGLLKAVITLTKTRVGWTVVTGPISDGESSRN